MNNNFNFCEEMVYGKKHLCKVNYDLHKYKFIKLVSELFETELNKLHLIQNKKYNLFTKIGKDSETEFHKKFYNKLNNEWDEFKQEYDIFIKNEILPFLNLDEVLVQKLPTFRVMLPNNVAVSVNHYDSDDLHKHPSGEINFIIALTDMFDTNTIKVEKMPRLNEYEDIVLKEGEVVCFNGNKCNHYNDVNKTGLTRVSLDFRILPLNYYNDNYQKSSINTNTRYIENHYYKRFFK